MVRVESWLDLGVLKALGEERGYRRVDATLMLLAVNDTRATQPTVRGDSELEQFQQRPHAGAYDFELGKDLAQLESLGSGVWSLLKLDSRCG